MNYLISDLDIEDIVHINVTYPKGETLSFEAFSEAVDWLDYFVDNEESNDKLRMLWALQGLKDLLHDATSGAVDMTISRSLLALGSGCSIG
ncbi:MAG: hypothetical protein CMI60_15370 [Parvibaculum sp.]|nr:hypothetical protein [Parvibaculum sp.]